MDWIKAVLQELQSRECPWCKLTLGNCGIRGMEVKGETLRVYLTCRSCKENSAAVVTRAEAERSREISRDEVLDAHEFLKQHGSLEELFAAKP